MVVAHRRERAKERPAGSYTTSLLDEGVAACARKVGEEAVEVTVAALSESDERVVSEVADLWFHTYVLLAARGLDPAAVEDELRLRQKFANAPAEPATASTPHSSRPMSRMRPAVVTGFFSCEEMVRSWTVVKKNASKRVCTSLPFALRSKK